jgi:uncharacterized protein YcfL
MRKSLKLSAVVLVLLMIVSCSSKRPIHPGALNQSDSVAYDTLLTAQAAIEQAKVEVANYPAAKPFLNKTIVSYNIAQAAYKGYHAGTENLASVQAQIAVVVQNIAELQKQLGKSPVKQ